MAFRHRYDRTIVPALSAAVSRVVAAVAVGEARSASPPPVTAPVQSLEEKKAILSSWVVPPTKVAPDATVNVNAVLSGMISSLFESVILAGVEPERVRPVMSMIVTTSVPAVSAYAAVPPCPVGAWKQNFALAATASIENLTVALVAAAFGVMRTRPDDPVLGAVPALPMMLAVSLFPVHAVATLTFSNVLNPCPVTV